MDEPLSSTRPLQYIAYRDRERSVSDRVHCSDSGVRVSAGEDICRNVEWQLCAARGTLPGQTGDWVDGPEGPQREGAKIRFALAPKYLEPMGDEKPLGACGGYMPAGCGKKGYASSDIYYMEACIYDLVCANRESLWQLEAGEDWTCEMNWSGFTTFRNYVLHAHHH